MGTRGTYEVVFLNSRIFVQFFPSRLTVAMVLPTVIERGLDIMTLLEEITPKEQEGARSFSVSSLPSLVTTDVGTDPVGSETGGPLHSFTIFYDSDCLVESDSLVEFDLVTSQPPVSPTAESQGLVLDLCPRGEKVQDTGLKSVPLLGNRLSPPLEPLTGKNCSVCRTPSLASVGGVADSEGRVCCGGGCGSVSRSGDQRPQ